MGQWKKRRKINRRWNSTQQTHGGSALLHPNFAPFHCAKLRHASNVIVSNSYGSAKSRYAVLSVDISDKKPVITQQPLSQVVKPGATVTFSARATGEAPLFYQWERDSTIIPGQTLPDCTIKNVKQSDLGWYYVTVTNSWGTARSDWALLSFAGDSLALLRK